MKLSKFNSKTFNILLGAMMAVFMISSCSDDNDPQPQNPSSSQGLGWAGTHDGSMTPDDIYFGNNDNVPTSYSLLDRFPPIGDQGSFGTCMAWAAAYNMRTSLDAINQDWSTNQELTTPSNQMSAKDLFLAIPNDKKVENCNGTFFVPALDQLLERGVADMQSVPYTDLGNCSQAPDAQATSIAANNKIASYREVKKDVDVLKSYIANNRPILFGAFIAEDFQSYSSDQVLTQDNGSGGGHAMVIIGYDDNRGPNGAFEVLNSWGETWGDNGTIWVDYNLMASEWTHATAFFVAEAEVNNNPEDQEQNDVVLNGDYDLIPWTVSDVYEEESPRERTMTYNIYNIGSQTVRSSQDWSMAYVYYNAFDAEDFGIILYDEYSTEHGSQGETGPISGGGPGISGNWFTNIDIPSLSGAAEEMDAGEYFFWNYTMPSITGYYYLVCIADVYDNIQEKDEINNYFFLTDFDGEPYYFEDGESWFKEEVESDVRSSLDKSDHVKKLHPRSYDGQKNAYTVSEIRDLIQMKKENGDFELSLAQYKSKKSQK